MLSKFFNKNAFTICFVLALIMFLALGSNDFCTAYTIDSATPNLDKTVQSGTGITQGDISVYLGILIKGILGVAGFVFFILMIYGGFNWMLARGNSEMTDRGKDTVIQAVIGLVIVVTGYALTVFITGRLTGN